MVDLAGKTWHAELAILRVLPKGETCMVTRSRGARAKQTGGSSKFFFSGMDSRYSGFTDGKNEDMGERGKANKERIGRRIAAVNRLTTSGRRKRKKVVPFLRAECLKLL